MVREVFKEFCLPALPDGKFTAAAVMAGTSLTTLLFVTGKLEDFSGVASQIKDEHLDGHGHSNNHEKEPAFSEDEETEEDDDDDIPLGESWKEGFQVNSSNCDLFAAKVRLKEKPSPTHGKDGDDDVAMLLDGEMRSAVEALNTDDKEAQ